MAQGGIQRINEDIQRVTAELLRDIKDPRVRQGMLSVTRADTTSDLRYSKIFVSIYGEYNEKELIRGLKSASGYLRRALGQSLNLRYTPELSFEIDKSIAHGAHISRIMNELDIKSGELEDE